MANSFFQSFTDLEFLPESTAERFFEQMYDTYSGAVFGIICEAVSPDKDLAENLLRGVFTEYYYKNHGFFHKDSHAFTGLIKIMVKILEKNGFRLSFPVTSGRLSFTRQPED